MLSTNNKFEWKQEGDNHILDLEHFKIQLLKNLNPDNQAEFPWQVLVSWQQTADNPGAWKGQTHSFDLKLTQLIREKAVEVARKKAVYTIECMFLNGTGRIYRFKREDC